MSDMPKLSPEDERAITDFTTADVPATVDQETLNANAFRLGEVKSHMKKLDEFYDPIIKPFKEGLDRINTLKKSFAAKIEAKEKALKDSIREYVELANYDRPANITVRRSLKIGSIDQSKLPEKYWSRVPNAAAIEADIKAGLEIPGVISAEVTTIAASENK